MRVLMITPELPSTEVPGSMAPTARQIRSLAELGIATDVLEMKGVPKLKYVWGLARLWRLASAADLIHAHFGYCGWLARMQFGKPVVVSFMGDDVLGTPRIDGRLEWFSERMVQVNRRLARAVDAVIVKSDEMARVVAPVPAHVIPNGVDVDRFCPGERMGARRQLNLPVDRRLVLFPGNPANPRKGYTLAEQATKRAGQIMGERVQLIPLWNVPPDDVPVYMNACDAMLMTSLIEGSPNVVKEALACNLPVVGVSVGDVAEILDGVEGCCVCPRDGQMLGKRLAEALAARAHFDGRRAILRRQLDLASVARRVLAVYENVLTDSIPRRTESKIQAHEARARETVPVEA